MLQDIEQRPGNGPEIDREDEIENEFVDYKDIAHNFDMLARLAKGWTAYLVAVLPARNCG